MKPSGRPPAIGGEEEDRFAVVEAGAQERLGGRRVRRAAVELAVAVEQRRQDGEIGEDGLANENVGHGAYRKAAVGRSLRL